MDVSDAELARAAEILRRGGLVAFPTETVYGLGANALDDSAIRRIYAVKGRPATSPLIVHIADRDTIRSIAAEWPEIAQRLSERFWPGPLTLVVKKSEKIPASVTAGLDTVGIRMPAHPVATALIDRSGLPLAAPSANRFTEVSPTTAEHVRVSLGNAIDLILDGGPTRVGIESTVLSVVGSKPVLLRPGMISKEDIESLIGPVESVVQPPSGAAHVSPGLHARHYSPRTPLYLLEPGKAQPQGRGRVLQLPHEPEQFAARLYAELRQADEQGWDWLGIETPPPSPEWAAILDRLRRASVAR
jgi:L-threonylcarbamoyladenylate synthase